MRHDGPYHSACQAPPGLFPPYAEGRIGRAGGQSTPGPPAGGGGVALDGRCGV